MLVIFTGPVNLIVVNFFETLSISSNGIVAVNSSTFSGSVCEDLRSETPVDVVSDSVGSKPGVEKVKSIEGSVGVFSVLLIISTSKVGDNVFWEIVIMGSCGGVVILGLSSA